MPSKRSKRSKRGKRKRGSGNSSKKRPKNNTDDQAAVTTTTTVNEQVGASNTVPVQQRPKKKKTKGHRVVTSRGASDKSIKTGHADVKECLNINSTEYDDEHYLLMNLMGGAMGLTIPLAYHAPVNGSQPYLKSHYPTDRLQRACGENVLQPWNVTTNFGCWGMGSSLRCRIATAENSFINKIRNMWAAPESDYEGNTGFFGCDKRTPDQKNLDHKHFTYLWWHRQSAMYNALKRASEDTNVDNWTYKGVEYSMDSIMTHFIEYCHERKNSAKNGTDDYGRDFGYSNLSLMAKSNFVSRHQINHFEEEGEIDEGMCNLREEMYPYNCPFNIRTTLKIYDKDRCKLDQDKRRSLNEEDGVELKILRKEQTRLSNLRSKRNDQVVKYFDYLLYMIETIFNSNTLQRWGYYYMTHEGNRISHKIAYHRHLCPPVPPEPEEIFSKVVAAGGVTGYFTRDLKWFVTHMYGIDGHKHLIDEPEVRQAYVDKAKKDIENARDQFLTKVQHSMKYSSEEGVKATNHDTDNHFVLTANVIFNTVCQ